MDVPCTLFLFFLPYLKIEPSVSVIFDIIIDQVQRLFIRNNLSRMNNQTGIESIQETHQIYDNSYDISPECKDAHQLKLFSSPIHVAEFLDMPKQENSSPEIYIEFSDSFKRILEKDNEGSEENEEILDIMGNRICEFDLKIESEESPAPFSPVEEDKENEVPTSSYLNTPLKIRRCEMRSPLQDITPSMTHKKRKTNTKLDKSRLLTPRTMEKSGLASSGLRRIERF